MSCMWWGIPCRPPRRISIRAWQGGCSPFSGNICPIWELKDFYEMEIASASIMRGFHGNAVRCLFYHGSENFSLSGMFAQAVRCAAGAEKGRNCGGAANGFAAHGRGNYSEDSGTGRRKALRHCLPSKNKRKCKRGLYPLVQTSFRLIGITYPPSVRAFHIWKHG